MDCHLSRLLLAFRRSELTAEDAVSLDTHLAGCPACATAARRAAAERTTLTAAMTAVPVPTGLRDRLVKSASRQQWSAWRQKAGWRAGAVAFVATLLGVGVAVYGLNRPHFSTNRFAVQLERERDFTEQEVRGWLKAEGLPETLPAEFDFFWHVIHGKQAVGGRDVPFVLFQNGQESCRVYVLRVGQFRTDENALNDFTGSRYKLTTVQQGDVIYVIAHTSDTLAPFLKRAALPG